MVHDFRILGGKESIRDELKFVDTYAKEDTRSVLWFPVVTSKERMGQKNACFWYSLSTRSEALFGSRTENWVSSQNGGATELFFNEAEKQGLTGHQQ